MKQFGAASLIVLVAVLLWGAEGRRDLWDLDLSIFVNHQTDMASQVWGIRLSPDETKVAIGFGPSWNFDRRARHVVVVAVEQPRTALREFELNFTSPWASGNSIVWSPSGTILVARTQTPTMFRLGPEAPCEFPKESEFGGFLSEDRMVLFRRGSRQGKAEIRILRSDCSLADSWETATGPADVLDTSPEQDLVAIINFQEPPASSAVELVAPNRHEVKQRWIWDSGNAFSGGFLFLNQGRLVCSTNPHREKPLPDVVCWDSQTGAKTAENDKVGIYLLGIESAGGDLLAITDYKYISLPWKSLWEFLDMGSEAVVPRRRLIWDIRTGKEIAGWELLQQKELWGKDLKSARTIKTNFVLSLSPTGKYIAEGGSGSVSVYTVQH
jgi:hypothetical protein